MFDLCENKEKYPHRIVYHNSFEIARVFSIFLTNIIYIFNIFFKRFFSLFGMRFCEAFLPKPPPWGRWRRSRRRGPSHPLSRELSPRESLRGYNDTVIHNLGRGRRPRRPETRRIFLAVRRCVCVSFCGQSRTPVPTRVFTSRSAVDMRLVLRGGRGRRPLPRYNRLVATP